MSVQAKIMMMTMAVHNMYYIWDDDDDDNDNDDEEDKDLLQAGQKLKMPCSVEHDPSNRLTSLVWTKDSEVIAQSINQILPINQSNAQSFNRPVNSFFPIPNHDFPIKPGNQPGR